MDLKLDTISLEEYESLAKGNQGFMKILLEKVIRQVSDYQPKIERAILNEDLQQLREDTHYIKPMMASLKMNTLIDVFEKIKSDIQNDEVDQEEVEQSLNFIRSSFEYIITTLRQKLDG